MNLHFKKCVANSLRSRSKGTMLAVIFNQVRLCYV